MDTSIVPLVKGANGYLLGATSQVGMAVALVNAGISLPQVGLGVAGQRLFGKITEVDSSGMARVQSRGFVYLPYVATGLRPVVGESVSVDGAGKVQRTVLVAAVNEVQVATFDVSPTAGHFTATFNGQTTAPILYTATGANIATALNLLSGVGASGFGGSGASLGAFTFTAGGALAGQPVPLITFDVTGLTTAGSLLSVESTAGVSETAQDNTLCLGFGVDPDALPGFVGQTLCIVQI